ncbi:MAG: thioredoxin domain-containing protein [Pyrinomonadaceae bacterium]|nr:thioredoxin domain-containing protein [Acidobacteriota bacterium]MBP7377212.1 thioredoxin domain-containing protein [Pyrinomonadaceae bacterium]
MKPISLIFVLIFFALTAAAQKPTDIIATATGHTIKLSDLSPEVQKAVADLPVSMAKQRTDLLNQMIYQRLLDLEAKAQNISVGQLIVKEKKKVADPPEATIKAVYEANRTALGDKTLEQARKTIVTFLRSEPESKVISAMYEALKTKYKAVIGKDINTPNLGSFETIATLNGKTVSAQEYDEFARVTLYELRAEIADAVIENATEVLFSALSIDEAKALGIDSSAFIAQEVTDKMKDYTDVEREGLLDALQAKLFAKYKAKIVYTAPEPVVQIISVDDDPSVGAATAPVTIVMFSDFQCSACAATHPLLKKAMLAFPGKIRFVVRDYPLESIHENGFRAALAANAANSQGKFAEYTEMLYANQDKLDDASLKKYAAGLGLNVSQFELDFNSEKTAAEVRKDMADGNAYGINSTPTIYINGVKARDLTVEGFKAAIERVLKK